uniref:DUF1206 domain-containing protein n=1 Tax=Thalassobaculum salexigens TaxID=455360 RepID=UPI00248EF7ED
QALDAIRSAPFGRILLALVAAGLIGFAVENLVEAIFRVVPRYSAGDETTLAERARRRVRRVVAAV